MRTEQHASLPCSDNSAWQQTTVSYKRMLKHAPSCIAAVVKLFNVFPRPVRLARATVQYAQGLKMYIAIGEPT